MELTQFICLAVIVLFTVIFIAWKIYKQGLRKVAIDLIVQAEERIKDNREKFDTVVNTVINRLPFPFYLIITTSTIEKFVQTTFNEIKKALDYQKGE